MTQEPLFVAGQVKSVPWWAMLGIVLFPGLVAVLLTITSIWIWKRVNRADQNPPLKASRVVLGTLGAGAFFGPFTQWALQKLVNFLTGAPIIWELVPLAAVVTGLASMAGYELLRWYALQKGWDQFYRLISVKHIQGRDNVTEQRDSDLTVVQMPREDDTFPRDKQ